MLQLYFRYFGCRASPMSAGARPRPLRRGLCVLDGASAAGAERVGQSGQTGPRGPPGTRNELQGSRREGRIGVSLTRDASTERARPTRVLTDTRALR